MPIRDTIGQLVLPFAHKPRFTRAGFVAAPSNAAARAWLLGRTAWPDRRLALWGARGCGKTHLLEIWASEHDAVLLSGPDLTRDDVARLFGAQRRSGIMAIALDDAQGCADERAVLHLLNGAREHGMALALAGRAAPARWPVTLADLQSRLRATMAVEMRQPEDTLLRIVLLRLLAERQIVVAHPVLEWLLRRLPRTAAAMVEVARRLDHAALATGRPVTRAMAIAELGDLLPPDAACETLPAGEA
ncbi:P-loop NTPase family protein [Novacetimonas pomaceti]|uniref:Chromosomal replication initiator DnaA n=1 Tax=Novacetimonas pomaceti TaxID=2021998 RepID=A0A318QCE5_9PROT|nr:chromosomal replication initiator DnaA [Novacetimonas pomaceti]MBV1834223.1 chromosomal replication initiator DnaA [Novacetimonas pomaceti]PYD76625.1 chromosomal replication initiator DnaA [Novacetimonas pomaceti]